MTRAWSNASAEGALTLVVGWRAGRKKLDGGWIELTDDVASSLRGVAQAAMAELASREPKVYSFESHLEPEEFFTVPQTLLEYGNELLALVRSSSDLQKITASQLPGRPLLFYASVIGNEPETRTAFVRTANPVMAASAGRILTRLRGSLTALSEPVFSFDRRVDFIVTSDGIAVLNANSFDRLFRDMPAILERIPEWLHDVSAHLPIDDAALAELSERCEKDSRLRRRLQAIRDRGHLANVTLNDVRKEAERQGLDPNEVVRDGRLAVEGIDAPTLLKLLNEDLMTGGLSGSRFSVDRKSPR
jgi:hypothetical protein